MSVVENAPTDVVTSDRLLTIRQAATALNQSVSTVRILVNRRTLPAVKLGRSVRVRQSDLEQFMRELPSR